MHLPCFVLAYFFNGLFRSVLLGAPLDEDFSPILLLFFSLAKLVLVWQEKIDHHERALNYDGWERNDQFAL